MAYNNTIYDNKDKLMNKTAVVGAQQILNVKVSGLNTKETLAWIAEKVEVKAKTRVVTPNPEQVVMAQTDGYFREILNSASLALADGGGLVWASRILPSRVKISERVTGEAVMRKLIERAAEKNWKVFLLGGKGNSVFRAERFLKAKFPKLKLEVSPGCQNVSRETREEREQALARINRFGTDLLFVAYGAPHQEKWLYENWRELRIKLGMGVGGAVDMLADPSLRPPAVVTGLGLGWLYRLLRQPWRLRRQLALLEFVRLVLEERIESRG